MKCLKVTIISLLQIALYCINEKAPFIISGIELLNESCNEKVGKFNFIIYGEFEKEPNEYGTMDLYLLSPLNAYTNCLGVNKGVNKEAYFICMIDIIKYPLNNIKLSLPHEAPKSYLYKFPNWKEIFSKNNTILENAFCTTVASNVFIPLEIESRGCIGNKNVFNIKGIWKNEKGPIINNRFNITLCNEKKNICECEFLKDNINTFTCKFEGGGTIQFDETYLKFLHLFKLEKYDSIFHVDKCP